MVPSASPRGLQWAMLGQAGEPLLGVWKTEGCLKQCPFTPGLGEVRLLCSLLLHLFVSPPPLSRTGAPLPLVFPLLWLIAQES